jgi:hypothetical protein
VDKSRSKREQFRRAIAGSNDRRRGTARRIEFRGNFECSARLSIG